MIYSWLTYNGNGLTSHAGYGLGRPDPYNPYDLPPFTLRLLFPDGIIPQARLGTFTQVSSSPNIWDLTYEGTRWFSMQISRELIAVLGGNTTDITQFGSIFSDNTNLRSVALFDTSNAISMSETFYNCTSLVSVPRFDTRNVKSFWRVFGRCSSLPEVPLWDTSSATDMASMFIGCSSLTTVPLFSTGNVETMGAMFEGCSSLVSVPTFDTQSVTDMREMFSGCSSLLNAPAFNTSLVTKMNKMFENCTSLTHVPLYDTSSLIEMPYMFDGCVNVESGALALYNQVSVQSQLGWHAQAFRNCGSNTVTGRAELAQIPEFWGGTMTD